MLADTLWRYRINSPEFYDGDSTKAVPIDVGMDIHFRARKGLRLVGVDCPEIRTKDPLEKEKGLAARDYSLAWVVKHAAHVAGELSVEYPFAILCTKTDTFSRPLVRLECGQGHCLNDDLIAAGHAVLYMEARGYAVTYDTGEREEIA